MNAVLRPVIENISKFNVRFMDVLILSILHHTQESGYTFTIGDVEQTVFGTICVISADNPANNLLGGFKEPVYGNYSGS